MYRSKAMPQEVRRVWPLKLTLWPAALLLSALLASCVASPESTQAQPTPLPADASSLASQAQQAPESDLLAPTDVPDEPDSASADPKDAAADSTPSKGSGKPESSTWKKVKDASKVADDAKAAQSAPATAQPVRLEDTVTAGAKASMSITRIEAVEAQAQGIGEIAGTATVLEIQIANGGDEALELSRAQVRMYFGEAREPAATLTDERTKPLPESLAPGESATARYVFSTPDGASAEVSIEFESGSTQEIQLLKGEVSS